MENRVAVIGLGHVGLTLALTLTEEGCTVCGIEKSPETLERLQSISPPFFEAGLKELLKKHLGKRLRVFDHLPAEIIQTYILCVGTPVKIEKNVPDLEAAQSALQAIAAHMQEGALVILRSTVPVGTSRKIFLPILNQAKKKFYYASCPERTCEGVALRELKELPQIIGGVDEPSREMADALFKKITPTVVPAPSLEAAEIVKLMDNCWRDTTFAFANEMALICEHLKLDATEVIALANLGYSRNTIPRPGFVGGPCLTKDPYLLNSLASKKDLLLPLTQAARRTNEQLPQKVCQRVLEFLKEQKKEIQNCKIFLSGLSFKGHPDTDDMRGSSSLDIFKLLRQAGAKNISGHDFVVRSEEITRLDIQTTSIEEGFKNADVVMILNNHERYPQLKIETLLNQMNRPGLFYDAWHLFPKNRLQAISGIIYGGVGF